jgi:hypothetical protein
MVKVTPNLNPDPPGSRGSGLRFGVTLTLGSARCCLISVNAICNIIIFILQHFEHQYSLGRWIGSERSAIREVGLRVKG